MIEAPTREELVGPDPIMLDHEEILRHLLGVTAADFRQQLSSESALFQEDFMWMAPAGLRYYLPVVYEYLQSPDSELDWEMSHGLLCSLSYQIEKYGLPTDVATIIADIAHFIDEHREKFDIGTDALFDGYLERIRRRAEPRPAHVP